MDFQVGDIWEFFGMGFLVIGPIEEYALRTKRVKVFHLYGPNQTIVKGEISWREKDTLRAILISRV